MAMMTMMSVDVEGIRHEVHLRPVQWKIKAKVKCEP